MAPPQIDWEEYNVTLILCICVLERHSHYLHYQIASMLSDVFDKYSMNGEQLESIWGVIEERNPEWLRNMSRYPPLHPDVQATIQLLERRMPVDPLAMPTYDELLNGRGAMYLILDQLLGIPEGRGFGWMTN
ncbi:MAG: hypothetical protein M1830_000095 [Pleopsidium flavum]|nr:MAG: hypothetical protein M1830_000095 [Pleopsidium flavum]